MTVNAVAAGDKLAKGDKFKDKDGDQVKDWFKNKGRLEAENLLWHNKNKCLESACELHGITVAQYAEWVTQGL